AADRHLRVVVRERPLGADTRPRRDRAAGARRGNRPYAARRPLWTVRRDGEGPRQPPRTVELLPARAGVPAARWLVLGAPGLDRDTQRRGDRVRAVDRP